jgi:hypothetical protein
LPASNISPAWDGARAITNDIVIELSSPNIVSSRLGKPPATPIAYISGVAAASTPFGGGTARGGALAASECVNP